MNALCLLVLASSTFGMNGLEPAAGPRAEVRQGAPEDIIERAFIPNERNAHGEVRLVRRDGALCVQTILCSPALVRGVQAIERKEARSWPAGAEGHEDSARFRELLAWSTDRVLEEFAARADGSDARRKLLIELTLDGDRAWFAFFGLDVDTSEGRLDVASARELALREVSPSYAARAIRLQLAGALHLNDTELERLLQ